MSNKPAFLPLPEGDRPGHETSDVRLKWILISGAIGIIFLAICLAGLVGLFWGFESLYDRYFSPSPESLAHQMVVYPQPFVLADPKELQLLHQSEQSVLSSYGWVDQKKGVVRIPVDRAMEIVEQQGLPMWGAPKPATSMPASSLLAWRLSVPESTYR